MQDDGTLLEVIETIEIEYMYHKISQIRLT